MNSELELGNTADATVQNQIAEGLSDINMNGIPVDGQTVPVSDTTLNVSGMAGE